MLKKLLLFVVCFLMAGTLSADWFEDAYQLMINVGDDFPSGRTFVVIYNEGLNADISRGLPTATFSASRGSSNPATYFDASGVMQKTETSDVGRFNHGFYDTSGWTAFTHAGLMVESASTNYLTDSMFGRAIGDDDWSKYWGTMADSATSLINIAGAKERKNAFTFVGDEGDWEYGLQQSTANDSFDASGTNIDITLSFWAKGSVAGITTGTGTTRFAYIAGTNNAEDWKENIVNIKLNDASVANLHATEWRRFAYSGTATNTDIRRLDVNFLMLANVNKPGAGENFDITITGVQVEKFPFATSFIPTTTASLTRNLENNKYENAGNRTAAVETCVIKLAPEFASGEQSATYIHVTDTKKRVSLFNTSSNDVIVYPNLTDSSPSSVADLINESWTAHQEMTIGSSVQSGTSPYVAGYFDGVADGTNETSDDFTSPAWGTYFWIGTGTDGSAFPFNGTILGIAFFDRILSDAEHLFLKEKDWRTLR